VRRLLAAGALTLTFLVAFAAPAGAHAQLVSTDPVAGATLADAPEAVTLRFSEKVHVPSGSVRVYAGSGERVDDGDLDQTDGDRVLRLSLPDLDDGGFVVTWRVVSADGHPISGGVTWRVGAGTAVSSSVLERLLNAEGGDTGLHVVAAVVRVLLFASLVVLVGGVAFVLLVWRAGTADGRALPLLLGAAASALAATVVSIGVEGADIAGRGVGAIVSLGDAADTWDTPSGKAAVVRLLLLAGWLGWLTTWRRHLPARRTTLAIAFALSTAVLATVSAAGHARTGRWTALAVPLDVVHQYAGAVWIGGLTLLVALVLPRLTADHVDGATEIAERFSRLAFVGVVVVAATGVVQGFRQVREVSGIRGTDYGRVLVVKVVLVALVVVLGGLSRSLLRARRAHAAELGDEGADDVDAELRHRLRVAVGFETFVAVAVLVATSLLVAANPTRAAADEGFSATKVVDGTVFEVGAVPIRPGPVTVHLYASDPSAGLTTTYEATATMALAERGITGVAVPLRVTGRAHWTADVAVPIAGRWQLKVTVVIGGLTSRSATFDIPIK
jgi:copper transport protein